MSALSTLLAVLSLDGNEYLQGLADSEDATGGFVDNLSNIGGAVVAAGLTAVVTTVTAVGVAAWEAGNKMDAAMDQIATKTGASGSALQGLQEDFEAVFTSVPTDAETAATAIGSLNSQLHLSGPALQELAKPLLEVTRLTGGDITANSEAFGRVIGDWSIPTDQAAGSLDKLFAVSQASGAPLDGLLQRIVQYGAPMRGFGLSFDDTSALMAKWQAEGVNVETVMGGLRIAAGKFTKDGVDMKTGLWDTIDSIKNAASSTDALTIATKVFGAKAAVDMVDTIRGGKFDIADFVETMRGADGTIMRTATSTMDWGEKWQIFQNKATKALAPLGKALMDIAGMALDMLLAFLSKPEVQDFITNLSKAIQDFAITVETWLPQIAQWFQDAWTWLLDHKEIIVAALAILTVAIVAWAITSAIAIAPLVLEMLPVIAVLLLIGVVAAILYLAWTQNWGGIQEKTAAVWAFIEPILQGIWDWLAVNIPKAGQALADFWNQTLWPAIVSGWDWLMERLAELWGWLSINIPRAVQTATDAWNIKFLPAIKGVWEFITGVFLPAFVAVYRFLITLFFTGLRALAGLFSNLVLPVLKKVASVLGIDLSPAMAGLAGVTSNALPILQNLAGFLGDVLHKALLGIANALKIGTDNLNKLSDGLDVLKLPDWLTPGSPTPWEIGLRGINDAMGELTTKQMPTFSAQLDLQPAAGTLGIDAQPSAAASFGGGATTSEAGAVMEFSALMADLKQTLRALPSANAQAVRDAVLQVVR